MSAVDRCSHRPPCPGCPRFGQSEAPAAAWREIQQLAQAADLPEPVFHRTSGRGHRHRARLAVRGRAGSPKIGLFQSASHRIVDIPTCAVHHPLINEATQEIKLAIRETGIEPYSDRAHRGALRYLQLVVERESDRVQLVLVANGRSPAILGELPTAIEERLGARLQGLFFNAQPARTNAILGPETIRLAGEPATRERFGETVAFFPPAAFGQNHLPLFARAIDRIATLVPDGRRIAEFYCGVGAIGLSLLPHARTLRFNERSPHGLAGLRLGLAQRPEAERARAEVLEGSAGDHAEAVRGVDIALLDPPRKGLDQALLTAIADAKIERLVYLSCGLPSLLAELAWLQERSDLRLAGIEAFDFFPFTNHVETLVWLDRGGKALGGAS